MHTYKNYTIQEQDEIARRRAQNVVDIFKMWLIDNAPYFRPEYAEEQFEQMLTCFITLPNEANDYGGIDLFEVPDNDNCNCPHGSQAAIAMRNEARNYARYLLSKGQREAERILEERFISRQIEQDRKEALKLQNAIDEEERFIANGISELERRQLQQQ